MFRSNEASINQTNFREHFENTRKRVTEKNFLQVNSVPFFLFYAIELYDHIIKFIKEFLPTFPSV